MITKIDNNIADMLMPLFRGKEIIVGIDSSKSNTALAIGDESGRLEHIIEFDGKSDGTAEVDTLALCMKHRTALKILLQGSKPIFVGIEDIITKVEKGKETGMTIHMSRFKITAVFMSLITFFQDTFNITPRLINNNSWKSAILPEEFRARSVGKGSLAYMKSIHSKLANYTDDATDAYCILKYICKIEGVTAGLRIKALEVPMHKHTVMIVSPSDDFAPDCLEFKYNEDFTLTQNADVMSNVLAQQGQSIGKAQVSPGVLTFEDIYTYCQGTFCRHESMVNVWVINE